jgi:hypothetical protein
MAQTLDLGTMFNIFRRHDEVCLGPGSKSKAKLHFTIDPTSHELPETICELKTM